MNRKILAMCLISGLAVNTGFAQKYEELAKTPPMGWSSWNKFHEDIDETKIKTIADALVSSGLRDAGYIYVNIDDCWHAPTRDKDGFPQSDPKRFPSGIKALADYMHERGLKLGIYSDAGYKTCAGEFGSAGHEFQDALQYARWEVDYLKYDWCNTPNFNSENAYKIMSSALREAGRPILFSICEWGTTQPWKWAEDVGHMWRTTQDIEPVFSDTTQISSIWNLAVTEILDKNAVLREYAGPGHWNDPDMLEIGNGLTENQERAHFSLWAMMAAPLILGNDVRDMNPHTLSVLMNKDVIAVDQDPLGIQGFRILQDDGIEIWWKPLTDNNWALCIFNRNHDPKDVYLDWQDFNIYDKFSDRSTDFLNLTYDTFDLWNKNKKGNTRKPLKIKVGGEDVAMYLLKPRKQ